MLYMFGFQFILFYFLKKNMRKNREKNKKEKRKKIIKNKNRFKINILVFYTTSNSFPLF